MTKTLNQIIFFSPPKSEYFFQQHWESEYLKKKKKHNLPPAELLLLSASGTVALNGMLTTKTKQKYCFCCYLHFAITTGRPPDFREMRFVSFNICSTNYILFTRFILPSKHTKYTEVNVTNILHGYTYYKK